MSATPVDVAYSLFGLAFATFALVRWTPAAGLRRVGFLAAVVSLVGLCLLRIAAAADAWVSEDEIGLGLNFAMVIVILLGARGRAVAGE